MAVAVAPFAEAPKTHQAWADLLAALAEPFPPEWVDFRPGKNEALAYIDARVVMDRLDAVVGPHNWTFEPVAVVQDAKTVLVALGRLTVHGVTKCDYGEASNFHGTKGAASDALKRAAVHWGVGRYLYALDGFPIQGDKIPERVKAQLRARLPRPRDYTAGVAPIYAQSGEGAADGGAEAKTATTATTGAGQAKGAKPLVFANWQEAAMEAKRRGVTDGGTWTALYKDPRFNTLTKMGAYLATCPVGGPPTDVPPLAKEMAKAS